MFLEVCPLRGSVECPAVCFMFVVLLNSPACVKLNMPGCSVAAVGFEPRTPKKLSMTCNNTSSLVAR